MKPVLDLIPALALSVGMVIGGVVAVSAALSPEKQPHRFTGLDSGDLWTSKPVRIDRSDQILERLPPRHASQVVTGEHTTASRSSASAPERDAFEPQEKAVDLVATVASRDVPTDIATQLPPEHVSWCRDRYRSYDPLDNTYRNFGGEWRDCVSPYGPAIAPRMQERAARHVTVSHDGTEPEADAQAQETISACRERYRSYRVKDNAYQPHGGGPRRQCDLASFSSTSIVTSTSVR
jgi:hypothetical protein